MSDGQPPPTVALDLTLCGCGSGLRRVRCCELDFAAQPDPAQHGLLASWMQTVADTRTEGKNREATRLLLRLLDLAPLWPEALQVLFDIRLAEGQKLAATALAARLVALEPENANALGRYAGILAAREMYQQAVEVARRGLLVSPRLSLFHQILGMSYTELGQFEAGESHYRQALAFLPVGQDQSQLDVHLAWNLRQQGRLEDAAGLYASLPGEAAARAGVLTSFAQVEAGRGRLDEAETLLAKALKNSPDDRLSALLWSRLCLIRGAPEAALERIAMTEARLAPRKLVVTEYIVRGEALERLGQYEPAWAAYQAGRAAQSEHMRASYDPAAGEARLAAIKTTFKADLQAALPAPGAILGAPSPVFLLGVPGSGTALLEHLLSLSPRVNPADQRASLPALATLLPGLVRGMEGPTWPFPQALGATICGASTQIPAMLAARYQQQLLDAGLAGPDTLFVTDRNEALPWLLGLALTLFPQAPVIHVLRHPVDVVLSCFTRDQIFEGNAGLTLVGLAQLYDQQMQAITHLRGQMTMRYLPVHYEALVTDPAASLQRIYDFMRLTAADPAALLATPPRPMSRVPVYRTYMTGVHRERLYRHRRFGDAFAACLPWLAPWIERLGYEMPAGKANGA